MDKSYILYPFSIPTDKQFLSLLKDKCSILYLFFLSDIFNLNPNPSLNNSQAQPLPQKRNSQTNKENTQNINYNTIDAIKPINKKKYMVKYHKSDIFNVKEKSSQIQKKPGVPKIRGIPNVSTCFEPMKDNAQFANDIKEYDNNTYL